MADEDDLHARVGALEAQVEALTASAREHHRVEPTSDGTDRRSSLAWVSRRGLLSAAAGAVAGGATSIALAGASNDDIDDHLRDEEAHQASAIAVTAGGEIVATDVLGALEDLDARLASLPQFSPDYLQDYACAYDDFFGGSTTSGQVGTLGWQVAPANGGTLAAASDSIENMPGWYELSTGALPNGSCAIHLEEISLYGHPLFVWEARVVVGPSDEGGPDATWRIGLHDSLDAGEPTNGYWFEGRGQSGAVACRTARGGQATEADAGFAPAGVMPHRFRIMSDGGGAAYFSIDDERAAVFRGGLPAESTESFGPTIAIARGAATGTAQIVRVDYVYLLWSVSR